jgi:phage regulator Rha-like protein
MSELVVIEKNEIYTTSLIISENINIDHKSVVKLLKDYSNIDELKRLTVAKVSTKGRAIINYLLTEEQALILVSLMNNTPEVIKFKVGLVKAFIKYRKLSAQLLSQKTNQEWIEKRKETKVMRRECTDIIQQFIAYAEEQGSQSASKYYMNFSRMELTGLFLLEQKFPNYRDIMNFRQLNLIEIADEVIANSLKDSMEKKIPYKECFQIAKECIIKLSNLMPKSPLPALLTQAK